MRRGLVYICFGRTLSTQFEFIVRAWTNPNFPQQGAGIDRLRTFEAVICGGYYFVPPAIRNTRQPWTWVLPPTEDG